MAFVAYPSQISVPQTLAAAYDGTLTAETYEVPNNPADEIVPTNHIRTTQDWGVKVKWEMHGAQAQFLVDEFHISAFLESIGTGPEYDLPLATPVKTNSVPLQWPGPQRQYEADIKVPAGKVKSGIYKLVVALQLFDDAPAGLPYPIAGMVEGPFMNFYEGQ